MWGSQRRRARRLSDYTDQVVLRRRNEGPRPAAPDEDDPELEALSLLAGELTDLEVTPPPNFQEELLAQIRRQDKIPAHEGWRGRLGAMRSCMALLLDDWSLGPTPTRTAVCAAALLAVVAFSYFGQSHVLSAADVLMRSNEALAATVQPGEVLYRRWRVEVTSSRLGVAPVTRERVIHEWMDGADFDHVAVQSTRGSGLRYQWASYRENGQIHSVAFNWTNEESGNRPVLHVEPTREDYVREAETFAPEARRLLHTYLSRSFIYMSIASERRFNREILEGTSGGPLPRSITVDHVVENGKPAFAVRAVDPSRVHFLWRTELPPLVSLAREETISYIAKDSSLTIKSQQDADYRDGRRVVEVRTLEEMRTYRMGELKEDPFRIDIPPGTRVNQQSAHELLAGVVDALQHDQSQGH